MTEKQSIFGRIAQLARANINALLDQAEDPQKMIDQLVRDYTNSIADAEQAVAQTIGNLRLAEQDYNEDVAAATEWGGKAAAASSRADQYRAAGDTASADKFDGVPHVDADSGGVPCLDGASARFVCRHVGHYEGGDHLLFIGRIEQLDVFRKPPLVFHAGQYRAISDHPDL